MINLTFPHYIYNIPDSRYASIPVSQPDSSRYLSSLYHHFVELNEMVTMEKAVDKCDYSHKPSRLLALANDIKK